MLSKTLPHCLLHSSTTPCASMATVLSFVFSVISSGAAPTNFLTSAHSSRGASGYSCDKWNRAWSWFGVILRVCVLVVGAWLVEEWVASMVWFRPGSQREDPCYRSKRYALRLQLAQCPAAQSAHACTSCCRLVQRAGSTPGNRMTGSCRCSESSGRASVPRNS